MRRKNGRRITEPELAGMETGIKKRLFDDVIDGIFRDITAINLFVLRDEFGFGKMRLQRVCDHVNDLFDAMAEGYLDIEDIINALKEEVGIEITKMEEKE